MQLKLRLLLMTVPVIFFSFVSFNINAQYLQNIGTATIATDKQDYAPRSNAVFTGTGFAPGEIVTLKVKNLFRACNTVDNTDSSYLPWTVVADDNGNFVTNWTVCDCAGDSLRLRAVGAISHDTAYAYFSDGSGDGSVTVNTTSVCANTTGNSFTFQFRTTNAGSAGGGTYPSGSEARILIPNLWTVPQAGNSLSPGYVAVSPVGVGSSATITSLSSVTGGTEVVISFSCSNSTSNGFNLTYGGGGTQVTAPSAANVYTFTARTKQGSGGTLTNLNNGNQARITVNPLPSAAITTPSSVCANSTGNTASVPSAGSGATYSWSITEGAITAGAGTNSITYTAGASGSVILSVTVTNSNNCSASSGNTLVTINPLPTLFTVTGGGPYCSGGPGVDIGLSGSEAGVNYQLKNGSSNIGSPVSGTGSAISFGNQTATGTYTVVATNATTACTRTMTGSVLVTINPLPNDVSGSFVGGTICNGDAGTLSFDAIDASFVAPYTIQYTDGTTTWSQAISSASLTTFNVAVNPTVTTNYALVSITNGNGCTITNGFTDGTATITVRATPTATITGTTTVCQNGSSPNITFSNPQSLPVTIAYNINGGSNLTINVAANSSTNVAAPTGTAGIFNYNLLSVNYQTAPNCANSISGTATITVRATPTATITGTTTVCQNGSSPNITFSNPQVLTERITYNINGGTNTTIDVPGNSSSVIAASTSAAGTFNYNLVSVAYLDGSPGCSNSIAGTATVTVRQPPTATIGINGPNPICSGSTTSIKFTGPSNGVVVYNINGGPGVSGSLNNGGNFVLTTAALTSNTTYNLESIAYGDNPGCSTSASGSITITVNQPPSINIQPVNQTVTYGDGTSFTAAATGTGPLTYQWQEDAGEGFANISDGGIYSGTSTTTLSISQPTVSMTGNKYRVIVSGACNPAATSAAATLTVNQRAITITADPQSKTYGDSDPSLTAQVTSGTIVSGDVASGSLLRVAGENVGLYQINKGTYTYGSNYAETYVPANLAITQRAITITADPQSKTYGDSDPSLTAQVTSGTIVSGDVASGSLLRVAGENVGLYQINKGTYTYGSNYAETYVPANLAITQRAITINVTSGQTKVLGTLDPLPFTYAVAGMGLAPWDQFYGSLVRASGESVGSYPISQGTLSIRNSSTLVPSIGNYTVTFNAANFTITPAATTITSIVITSSPVQYSDPVSFTATITSPTAQSLLNSTGGTVEFKLKSSSGIVTSLGSSAYPGDWNSSNGKIVKQFNIMLAPDTYTLITVFTPTDNVSFTGTTNNNSGVLVVTRENAVVDYTGDQLLSTATASTTTATVLLRANILDISAAPGNLLYDAFGGDIRKAKVKFIVRNNANAIVLNSGWRSVDTLVNNADSKVGKVSYTFFANIGSADAEEYHLKVLVGYDAGAAGTLADPTYNGYYISSPEDVVVTVYKPNGDFITGGGYIINTNSVGSRKADLDSKTNFGFNVKFNKKNTNLQGNLNFIFRRKEVDNIVHTYQVKSNAMQSLGVNATNIKRQTANFVSKSNITDITNPLAPVLLGGNKYMYINMIDNGEPGTKDSISFVLVDGTSDPTVLSNIIYSSNWIATKTELKNLGGGNLVVHSGFNVGTGSIASSANPRLVDNQVTTDTQEVIFDSKAYPNPTTSQFSVTLESSNTADPIRIVVYGVNGKIVEQKQKLTAGQTFQLGALYRPGVYILEIVQGTQRKQLKLVKIPD